MSDRLVYGKSDLKGVVGLEVTNDTTEVFVQDKDGVINSVFLPNKFWILSSKNIDGKFVRLQGDLHYCWGKQFSNRDTWKKCRSIWKNEDIFTVWNPEEAFQLKDGITFYRDMKISELSLFSFDLETTGLDGYADDAQVLIISTTFRNHLGDTENKLFTYNQFESEAQMIESFCDYIMDCDPSIILGHNIIPYDFLYLKARCEVLGINLYMGRDGSPVKFDEYDSNFRLDGTRNLNYKKVSIYGREICDTFFLVTKMDVGKTYESHALKPLIKEMGLEKEGREYYDAGSIRNNYKNATEWAKIISYAEADAEDPIKLFDHFAPPMFYWAQKIPKPFTEILLGATGSQINSMMVRSYLQEKHSIPKADDIQSFQGAISYGKAGIYNNCIRWDVSSLYPSIILTYNIYSEEKDPNANFLKICKILTEQRLKNKRLAKETGEKYYDDLQNSEKIGINSMYGFLGANGLQFNSARHAEMVTRYGREILEKAIKWSTSMDFNKIAPEYYEEGDSSNEESA